MCLFHRKFELVTLCFHRVGPSWNNYAVRNFVTVTQWLPYNLRNKNHPPSRQQCFLGSQNSGNVRNISPSRTWLSCGRSDFERNFFWSDPVTLQCPGSIRKHKCLHLKNNLLGASLRMSFRRGEFQISWLTHWTLDQSFSKATPRSFCTKVICTQVA